MKKIIFLLNAISVVFSVIIAFPFVIAGIVLSIGGPNFPYEAFYVDFGLLFLHLFYIIFLVIGVLYSLYYYNLSVKMGFAFAFLPYIYIIFLMILYGLF